MQDSLLPEVKNFSLVRITGTDVRRKTDWLFNFRMLIQQNEDMYPAIEKWLERRVFSGLKSGERIGYIGLCDETPVASAIVKKGEVSKFCHLRLDDTIQDQGIGEFFFVLMALETRDVANRVKFTLPANLWDKEKDFFSSFGFSNAVAAKRQYRAFEEELFCTAPFSTVFSCVRQKLPKMFGRLSVGKHLLISHLLISLTLDNAEKVLSGLKSVEIRKRFSKSWENKRATIYASRPAAALVGEADIVRVKSGDPEYIWNHFGHSVGCKREEYDSYVGNENKVFAIVLDNVTAFAEQVPISQLSHLLDEPLNPPQSYLGLSNSDKWSSAVSLAAALQSALGVRQMQPPKY